MSGIELESAEKGWLGALITGAAVGAFVASNLYVFGLSLALHQNLAAYFEIFDYLQVTPAWGLPALLSLAVVMAYPLLIQASQIFWAILKIFRAILKRLNENPHCGYGLS